MSGILPTIVTTGTLADEKARLKSALQGTDQSVQACVSLPDATRASWGVFYVGAMSFVAEDAGIWGLGSQMDRAQSYEAELVAWQGTLKSAGCGLTIPAFDPNAPQPNAWTEPLKWAAIIAGTVAGAYVIGKGVEVVELFKDWPAKKTEPAKLKPATAKEDDDACGCKRMMERAGGGAAVRMLGGGRA